MGRPKLKVVKIELSTTWRSFSSVARLFGLLACLTDLGTPLPKILGTPLALAPGRSILSKKCRVSTGLWFYVCDVSMICVREENCRQRAGLSFAERHLAATFAIYVERCLPPSPSQDDAASARPILPYRGYLTVCPTPPPPSLQSSGYKGRAGPANLVPGRTRSPTRYWHKVGLGLGPTI